MNTDHATIEISCNEESHNGNRFFVYRFFRVPGSPQWVGADQLKLLHEAKHKRSPIPLELPDLPEAVDDPLRGEVGALQSFYDDDDYLTRVEAGALRAPRWTRCWPTATP